jgi:nucleoside triphosphate pyrophosphatase
LPIDSKIILASASPRRAEILRNAGFEFSVISADVDESLRAGESAPVYVERLAREKANAAAARLRSMNQNSGIIVAADTTVVLDGEILGKPESAEDAHRMLRSLSGKWHEVFTGLAVLPLAAAAPQEQLLVEQTRVQFAKLCENEIDDYVATGEPFDKAGAYAIQGLGGKFIPRIEGCYFNVMGLPLARLYEALRKIETVHG